MTPLDIAHEQPQPSPRELSVQSPFKELPVVRSIQSAVNKELNSKTCMQPPSKAAKAPTELKNNFSSLRSPAAKKGKGVFAGELFKFHFGKFSWSL